MGTMPFTQWVSEAANQWIDVDGYGDPPWQCHDVWLSYLLDVVGGKLEQGYAPSDYTDSVFTQSFPSRGLGELFTKHHGIDGVRAGDVVFWPYGSAWFPWSHVAVATGPARGQLVPCLTQNPGKTVHRDLITRGALGYLRPRKPISPAGTIPPVMKQKQLSKGDDNMGYYVQTGSQGSKYFVRMGDGRKRKIGTPEWNRIRMAESKGFPVPLITIGQKELDSIPNW